MNDKLTLIAAIFVEAFGRQSTNNIAAVTIRAMLADEGFSATINKNSINITVLDFSEDVNLTFSIFSHGKNIMVRAVAHECEDPIYRNVVFAEATHALHFVLDCANNRDIEDTQSNNAIDESWGAHTVPTPGEKSFDIPEPEIKEPTDRPLIECAHAWVHQHKKSIYLRPLLRKEFGITSKELSEIIKDLAALEQEAIVAVALKYEGDLPAKLNETTGIFGSLDRALHVMAYESTSKISRIRAWISK